MAEMPQSMIDDWFKLKPIQNTGRRQPEIDTRSKRMLRHAEKQQKAQDEESRKRREERERKEKEMKDIASRALEFNQVMSQSAMASRQPAGKEDDWVSYDVIDSQLDSLHNVDTEILPGATRESAKDDHFGEKSTVETFANYRFDHTYDPLLPMTENREKVVKTIEDNPVTVVTGPTGSGKTTQVPQYILDKCAAEKRHCNIVCTQPRKIAAMSIAKRVCQERGWRVGSLVGFQVQMNREVSEDTRLMYVTTGVLLRKLVTNKHMNMYTHVIIDEVHERDQDTDFVLLVVRKFLRSNSQGVKVILMSATIESEMFASYYASVVGGCLVPAPVISVEGKIYPVIEFYSDDMVFLGEVPSQEDYDNPGIDNSRIQICGEIIRHFDLVESSNPRDKFGNVLDRGTVLVFLPGLAEITKLDNYLKHELKKHHLWIIPLHSSITIEEQRWAFVKPRAGERKVILSTNIAESSITIPDIKYVIDFCLTKELMCDPDTNYQSLRTNWASKSSLTQRKGRAGRCSGGRCYRLISRKFKDQYIREYAVPEMQRCPLDQLILQAKLLDLGEPKLILGLALQPPHLEDIEKTILCLKEVGALSTLRSGIANPYDGDLTFVGRVLATLPVDIHLGKLIILGHVFGCIEEAIIVAASFSLKSFFARPYKQELDAYRSKLGWGDYSHSDAVAALRAFREWWSLKQARAFSSARAEYKWCKQHMIQHANISEVANLVDELIARLSQFNLKVFRDQRRTQTEMSAEDLLIFKIVLAGAFYPNFFLCTFPDEHIAVRDIGGRDPTTTVQGMPQNGLMYRESLVQNFKACGKGKKLHFEGSRVYVEFERPRPSHSDPPTDSSQPVLNAVYCALKMRQLRIPLVLEPCDSHWKSVAERGYEPSKSSVPDFSLQQVALPTLGEIKLVITEVIDAGHFWAHLADDNSVKILQDFDASLNQLPDQSLPPLKSILEGMPCLAKFSQDKRYYRAKIDNIRQSTALVTFVDYGNTEQIPLGSLKQIPPEFLRIPMQAFECFLSHVRPSHRQSVGGNTWSTVANRRFMEMTDGKILFAQIFSKVDDVLRLELIDTTGRSDVIVNQWLVDTGYAELAPEPHNSKVAHDLAVRNQEAVDRGASNELNSPTLPSAWNVVEFGQVQTSTAASTEMSARAQKGRALTARGPSNPYELGFFHMAYVGAGRGVRVERDSINSIAIQEDPLARHQRLMCAASVNLAPSRDTLLARNTTIMPHLLGLPELLVLLFAPTVEMRTDSHRCRYTGCISGLGYDPNSGKPIFSEHDMEVVFGATIDQDDLNRVNSVRMAINLAVSSEDKVSAWDMKAVRRIQEAAREKLVRLVTRERRPCHETSFNASYVWKQVSADLLMSPSDELETMEEDAPFFTLQCGVRLHSEEDQAELNALPRKHIELQYHCKELRSMASMSLAAIETFCRLCYVRCATPRALLYHLQSKSHRQKEELLKESSQY